MRVFVCRVSVILQSSQRIAKINNYKPIRKDTPHFIIRRMMEELNCVLCGEPLIWEIGIGKTPHLHHDHSTGAIIGFAHPKCNPLALQNRINELEAEIRFLQAA